MNLYETLIIWKDLGEKGVRQASETNTEAMGNIDKIIIAGMGGSGIIGDVLQDLQLPYYFDFPIIVVKEPWLPSIVTEKTLVISLSYSGNTFETITSTVEAVNKGAKVVVITSGGRLAEIAEERDVPLIKLTPGLLPRAAFPEMFFTTITLLSRLGLTGYLSQGIIDKSLDILAGTELVIEQGKKITEELYGKHPVFVACRPYFSISLRFKNDLAENSKMYSTTELLPEAGHNSLEALFNLDNKGPYKLVYLSGSYGPCYNFIESMKTTLGNMDGIIIDLSGHKEVFNEILWGFWLSGFTSVFLAQKKRVDPDITPGLSKFRKKVWEKFFGK